MCGHDTGRKAGKNYSNRRKAEGGLSRCNLRPALERRPLAADDYGAALGTVHRCAGQHLFRRFPTPEALAAGALPDIEDCIRSCGLYRVKAQNIRDASAMLVRDFGGRMPDSMNDLLKLPGVGRKVANLILGDLYGTGGTVADTHCIRICGRFGMYPETLKDPVQVERIMDSLLPQSERSDFCHRIVLFGRDICTARSPKCSSCPVRSECGRPWGAAPNPA